MSALRPGQTVDSLELDLINGTKWKLEDQSDQDHPWRLIMVYRGLHCPICKKQLQELAGKIDQFADEGITVVAASMDTKERAQKAYDDWELTSLPIAYEMTRELADRFGLYLSSAISDSEPELFAEPAALLFHEDLFYAAWVQSTPFARPALDDLLSSIKFVRDKEYPARGVEG